MVQFVADRIYLFAFSANPAPLCARPTIQRKGHIQRGFMDRRTFLKGAIAVHTAAQLTGFASPARGQQKEFTPRLGTWRTFEITTRIEVLEPAGTVRAWLPVPSGTAGHQGAPGSD